jgi:hypothetical protein
LKQGYQQAVIPVANVPAFGAVRTAIEGSFSSAQAAEFLKKLERSKIRVRDFETVLGKGLLGPLAQAEYGQLDNGDRGQLRELYLASLERVAPELRQRFFKLYAYY